MSVPSTSTRPLTKLIGVPAAGAKLGAILCGFPRSPVDTRGLRSPSFRALRTPTDAHGPRLEIFGSEGWGFESLRDISPAQYVALHT
jgi:hypothetical protein